MRKLVSFLLLAWCIPCAAAEPPPLGEAAKAWATSLGHGAVATAEKRDGRWSFAVAGQPFAAGHAEVPPERVVFEIGSTSKVFTGILLADAVAAGKLQLDDTLAERLPVQWAHPATGAVTLGQLATHTSCLPRLPDNLAAGAPLEDPYAHYDKKALFEYLAGAKLDGKPPCESTYSNLGFGVLGVVLETVHGKPWAALVQEKIAGPLGMTDTVQELSADQRTRFAEPWDGAKQSAPWTFQAMAGGGALRSTLAAWEAAGREPVQRAEVKLPPETLDEYVGVYSVDKTTRFTLVRQGDGLVSRLTGQPFAPIFASAKDEFFYRIVDAQLSFHRDEAGKIDRLTLHQNGRELPARREPGPPPRRHPKA